MFNMKRVTVIWIFALIVVVVLIILAFISRLMQSSTSIGPAVVDFLWLAW